MKRNYAIFVLCFICLITIGQEVDYNNFSGIKCSGPIPKDFITPWSQKFKENPIEFNLDSIAEADLTVEEFWMHQNYAIDLLLHSGKFSFGDPITEYINAVADELLSNRPKLRSKLRFYLYKDPSTNAFCLGDGIIGVNNGLMTNIKSEAELAFVLAHEISHYLEGHIYEDYFANYNEYDDKSELERIEDLIKRSKKQELDADSLGLKLFLESAYDTSAVSSAMVTLYESYHPAGRCKIKGNPLAFKNSYSLPPWTRKNHNIELSDDYNYLDEGSEHPNIAVRIKAMSKLLELETSLSSRTLFILPVERFRQIRTHARFENVQLNLRRANFTEAIYEIECLLNEFPESNYLHKSKLRAVYGLTILKYQGEAHRVIPVPFYQPGPVKDLNFILFSLNQYEFCAIGLRMANDLLVAHPEDRDIRGIQREFHRMFYLRFLLDEPSEILSNKRQLPERTIALIDSILPDLEEKNRIYQIDYKLDSLYIDSMLNKETALRFEVKAYNFSNRKFASDISIKKDYTYLTVLDPTVHIHPKFTKLDDKQIALECETSLMDSLPTMMPNYGMFGDVFAMTYLDEDQVEQYNRYTALKALYEEIRLYKFLGFPTFHFQTQENLNLKSPFIFISDAYIEPRWDDIVYFKVYDIRTGELLVSSRTTSPTLYPRDFRRIVIAKLIELKRL